MPLADHLFVDQADFMNEGDFQVLHMALLAIWEMFKDVNVDFASYVESLIDDVKFCRKNLQVYIKMYNEVAFRIVKLLPGRVRRELVCSACEGCCVQVYQKMLMLKNEKRNQWNEVEFKSLDRSIFVLSSDPCFLLVVDAHEIMRLACKIVHLFVPQILFSHCTPKRYPSASHSGRHAASLWRAEEEGDAGDDVLGEYQGIYFCGCVYNRR